MYACGDDDDEEAEEGATNGAAAGEDAVDAPAAASASASDEPEAPAAAVGLGDAAASAAPDAAAPAEALGGEALKADVERLRAEKGQLDALIGQWTQSVTQHQQILAQRQQLQQLQMQHQWLQQQVQQQQAHAQAQQAQAAISSVLTAAGCQQMAVPTAAAAVFDTRTVPSATYPMGKPPDAVVKKGSWAEYEDEAGNKYYYNATTEESTWERPAQYIKGSTTGDKHTPWWAGGGGNEEKCGPPGATLFVARQMRRGEFDAFDSYDLQEAFKKHAAAPSHPATPAVSRGKRFSLRGRDSQLTRTPRVDVCECRYGNLLRATITLDRETGVSKGFGFVSFSTPEEADAAMTALHGALIAGKRMRIEKASARQEMGLKDNSFHGRRGRDIGHNN